jgi:hypothetical protein
LRPLRANTILAISTLVATIFVALQAWYARVAYVSAAETRLLEDKLDLCFDNFDAAAALDAELRSLTPGSGADEEWPPRIDVMSGAHLAALHNQIVPLLNRLETSLAKASILGEPDRFRLFLTGQIKGLAPRLMALSPARIGEPETNAELDEILTTLSDFLGAQYAVFEGCRLVAEGDN